MSVSLRYSLGEVGIELRTMIALNCLEGEECFSSGSLKEINRISGVRASIRSGVRPAGVHIKAGEDVYLCFIRSHEVNGVHLDQITRF